MEIVTVVYQHGYLGSWGLVAGRHAQGANLLFCDGRVEYGKRSYWGAPAQEHLFPGF